MSDIAEYEKLMLEKRRGTSANFNPSIVSAGDPAIRITEDKPMSDVDEAQVKAMSSDIRRRNRLLRAQEFGENLSYAGLSPTLTGQVLGAAGDALYTSAATARYLGGEEEAAPEAVMGGVALAAPLIPVAMIGKLFQKADVEKANKLLKNLGNDMSEQGKVFQDAADSVTKRFNEEMESLKAAAEKTGWTRRSADGSFNKLPGKFGKDAQKALEAQSVALKKLADEYGARGGQLKGKFGKPVESTKIKYGVGGAMEERMVQPEGGESIITGRKGARSPSREDQLREESRMVVAKTGEEAKFRKMTKKERAELEATGDFTRDPSAPMSAVVDDDGKLLKGREIPKRPAREARDPYPEGTAEIVARMPLEKEYTKGTGQGTVGMSESLVRDLSDLAMQIVPPSVGGRRAPLRDPAKYFDTLTPAQQKEVLAQAKLKPGLGRDIARHELSVKQASEGLGLQAGRGESMTPQEFRAKKEAKAADARAEALTRREAQAELKGVRKATGTTPVLRKRVRREEVVQASDVDKVKAEFLFGIKRDYRFSDAELGFIEQEVAAGTFPPTADAINQFAKMKEGFEIVYNPSSRKFEPRGKRTGGLIDPDKRKTKEMIENPEFRKTKPVEPPTKPELEATASLTAEGLPKASEAKRPTSSEPEFKAQAVSGKKGEGYIPVERKPTRRRQKELSADEMQRRRGLRKKKAEKGGAADQAKKKVSEPLTVEQLAEGGKFELYVGSPKSFTEFRPSSTGQFGAGVYLSADPEAAREFSMKIPKSSVLGGPVPESGNLMTVEVDIKNPLNLGGMATLTSSERKNWIRALKKHGRTKELEMLESENANPIMIYDSLMGGGIGQAARPRPAVAEKAKLIAQDAGYDSIIGKAQSGTPPEVVVFDPANIKIKSTEKISRKVEAVKPPQPPVTVAESDDVF